MKVAVSRDFKPGLQNCLPFKSTGGPLAVHRDSYALINKSR